MFFTIHQRRAPGLIYTKIKTLSPLRSSDRRKIADQIISDYHIEVPKEETSEENGDAEATNVSPIPGVGALRNSLLPEGSLSAKFTTTAGPDLKPVSGTVYVGAELGGEPRVLWIKLNDRLFPTGKLLCNLSFRKLTCHLIVYSLWRHPKLLPLLHTPDVVLHKLRGGADLMTPGLARGPPFPETAVRDAVVAVASLERPSVPMFVGICEIDISTLGRVQGAKGHAVRGVHWCGDEIWSWGQGGKHGSDSPEQIEGWDDGEGTLNEDMADLELEASDNDQDQGGISLDTNTTTPKTTKHNQYINGEDVIDEAASEHEMTTKGIVSLFISFLLKWC